MEQSRWKSAVAWTAAAGVLFMVVKSWFGFEIPNFEVISSGIIGVFVLFGVFNNPEKKDGF